MPEISGKALELLTRPIIVALGSVRPDGAPQVNPMWVVWDGEFLWFTHTTRRQKYRNFEYEPRVSVTVIAPGEPHGYTEIRGVVDHIDPDPEGKLYERLSMRYEGIAVTPPDAADRVAVAVRPEWVYAQ